MHSTAPTAIDNTCRAGALIMEAGSCAGQLCSKRTNCGRFHAQIKGIDQAIQDRAA